MIASLVALVTKVELITKVDLINLIALTTKVDLIILVALTTKVELITYAALITCFASTCVLVSTARWAKFVLLSILLEVLIVTLRTSILITIISIEKLFRLTSINLITIVLLLLRAGWSLLIAFLWLQIASLWLLIAYL